MPLVEERHPLVKHKVGLHCEGGLGIRKSIELLVKLARPIYKTCRDLKLNNSLQWISQTGADSGRGEYYVVQNYHSRCSP